MKLELRGRNAVNEFLFQKIPEDVRALIAKNHSMSCRCCPMPPEFLAGFPGHVEVFCAICVTPYVVQVLKNMGASLQSIEAGFLKLSELVDAPPVSGLVM